MTMKVMIRHYHKHSAAARYLVGFEHEGVVYYVLITWDELTKLLREDHASSKRGGALKARIYVSSAAKKAFLSSGRAVRLCGADELIDAKYNRGQTFERIITELLTETVWKPDRIPFYEKGDINLNGEEIQIKYQDAELTNESTIQKMLKKMKG